ncbi:MAG: V-type ATP synthase subunit I [Clostridia bacterium]|nr:V-type ATP synthase subunit I [Clostridia bacterium]
MAILEMNKVFIYGLNEQRKSVLEFLHKQEIMEVDDFDSDKYGFSRQETVKSISQFDSYISSGAQALAILNEYFPEKTGMFSKRIHLDESKYSMTKDEINFVNKNIQEIIRAKKAIKANENSIGKINLKQSQITPLMSLDVPMNCKGTNTTMVKLGTLEHEWSSEQITVALNEAQIESYYFEIINTTKQQTYVWFVYPKDIKEKFEQFLRNIGFTEPGFSLSHRTCSEKYKKLEEDKQKIIQENEKFAETIKGYLQYRKDIELFYDHLVMRKEKYEALSHLGITENTFVITGFIPKCNYEALKKSLTERFDVEVTFEEPDKDEAPVVFSNNAFAAPVEGITSDYSMPSANDIDPNPIMSFFYYLFFGMMFSDAGYGLLMMIVCGILGYTNVIEKKKRRAYKMFFLCGVSTTFWGIMYGSFFGDMINTISSTFFNSSFQLKPLLLNPTDKPLELMIISVSFGMIHIITGMCIKFYMLWKQGEKTDAICDVGFWITALLGISAFAAGMGLNISVLGNIGKIVMIAGFAGLLLTGGRKNKNIFSKLIGGVLSLYDITSYVGDVLSYSRLMALGLATGVIASVINILGSLGGNSVTGIILYIVISVVGHAMNFAINCLGAYVHTNRLQYVEFFQKFYEGGGRKFKPFAMNTKYFNFSKE